MLFFLLSFIACFIIKACLHVYCCAVFSVVASSANAGQSQRKMQRLPSFVEGFHIFLFYLYNIYTIDITTTVVIDDV